MSAVDRCSRDFACLGGAQPVHVDGESSHKPEIWVEIERLALFDMLVVVCESLVVTCAAKRQV
jgi:hypothetical protein